MASASQPSGALLIDLRPPEGDNEKDDSVRRTTPQSECCCCALLTSSCGLLLAVAACLPPLRGRHQCGTYQEHVCCAGRHRSERLRASGAALVPAALRIVTSLPTPAPTLPLLVPTGANHTAAAHYIGCQHDSGDAPSGGELVAAAQSMPTPVMTTATSMQHERAPACTGRQFCCHMAGFRAAVTLSAFGCIHPLA